MSCWLEEKKKKKTTEVCICLPQLGSYSYGVSQPSLYLPPGHFFMERQKSEEAHNPVTQWKGWELSWVYQAQVQHFPRQN